MLEDTFQEAIESYMPSNKILRDLIDGYTISTEVLYRDPYRAPELFDNNSLFKQFIEHELKTTGKKSISIDATLDSTQNAILFKDHIYMDNKGDENRNKDIIKFLGLFNEGEEPIYDIDLVLNNSVNVNGMSVSMADFIHILHGFLHGDKFEDLFDREEYVLLENKEKVFDEMRRYMQSNKAIVSILKSIKLATKIAVITPKRIVPRDSYEESILKELNQYVA